MYKLWLKRLTVDYIKISEEKFDSDHSANERRIIMYLTFLIELYPEVEFPNGVILCGISA